MIKAICNDIARPLIDFCNAWRRRDFDGAIKVLGPSVVYAMYIPAEVVPFGGETVGKAAMADRMRMILTQFDTLQFDVTIHRIDQDLVHARVRFAFRHKVTREVVDGNMRLIAQVVDGLIVDLKEFHDVERIKAFMRLVSYVAASRP